MDIRKIKKLIEILNETGVGEIEIKEGEQSIRISRQHNNSGGLLNTSYSTTPVSSAIAHPPLSLPVSPVTIEELPPPTGHTVKSPMVGTLFTSPAPGAPNFVKIGQNVKLGDTLCIIEAMKMFNKIEADLSGVIKAQLVENGHPVEFDQPLFIIEPQP
jgi:acetyl-CoA carboxylase biotin carboxyl carrier protein